jgi:hypothetical protein
MAPKRQSGEPKTGLIVTLVFFVLATIILGVTTYMGFADQAELQKKEKDAGTKLGEMTKERDWYKFQAHLARAYMGHPAADAEKDLLRQRKAELEKGSLSMAGGQKDKDDFTRMVATLDKGMAWDTTKAPAPPMTYEGRLTESARQYGALAKSAETLRGEKEAAEKRAEDAEKLVETEKATFNTALNNVKKQAQDDRKNDRDEITRLLGAWKKENEDKGKAQKDLQDTQGRETALQTKLDRREGELAKLKDSARELKETVDEQKGRLTELYVRSGVDPKAVETATIDAKAQELIRNWKKDWQIVSLDRRGTNVYVNLGSDDGVTPQLTFSVHGTGADGRLTPAAKGTLEIVQVIGPRQVRAGPDHLDARRALGPGPEGGPPVQRDVGPQPQEARGGGGDH